MEEPLYFRTLYTYMGAGTYTVTLTASNSAGSNTDTETGYITVNKVGTLPVALFVANTTSGSLPLTVQFVDSSTNSSTSWLWSFGDGSTSTVQNPAYTYKAAGTYAVTLTVTNTKGANTLSQSGYIVVTEEPETPVASFAASETSGDAPLTVQFVDSSTNSPTSLLWSFRDGSTSEQQDPSHTYTSAGTYMVSLTAANAAGSNIVTRNDGIIVTAAPVERTSEASSAAVSSPPQVTETGSTVPATDTHSGSSGLLPHAGVGVLVVAGILSWVFIKGPRAALTLPGEKTSESKHMLPKPPNIFFLNVRKISSY